MDRSGNVETQSHWGLVAYPVWSSFLGPADYTRIKKRIQEALIERVGNRLPESDPSSVRAIIEEYYDKALAEAKLALNRTEQATLLDQITAEILGYGPIEPLLRDDTTTEVMVNGPRDVYIERGGKIFKTNLQFEDEAHLMRIIQRIVTPLGRRLDETSPMVDGRLPDGSRINAIIPPLSLIGPVLTVRKFAKDPYMARDLIGFGTITETAVQFLELCVKARLNIIISGGSGSGKTTFLNVLSGFVPFDERIVTIEDAHELQLKQEHVVFLEKRPPNIEGKGEITIRQLVINALRMRPDRIIVGEVRGGEALDMLQAMNTGHDGSLTTVHSNSPRDTLRRLETMVLMAGLDLPLKAIREQVASAMDLVVHLKRFRDGVRRVVQISEVQGLEGDTVVMQDIFKFEQVGVHNGQISGELHPTGIRPKFCEKMEESGFSVLSKFFSPTAALPRGTLVVAR